MSSLSESKRSDSCDTDKNIERLESEENGGTAEQQKNIIITNPSMDQLDEADVEVNGEVEQNEPGNKLLGTQIAEDAGEQAVGNFKKMSGSNWC